MTIAMTMVMAMANLAIAVTMAMAMTMITITIAIVMIMAIAIPRPSHLKNKQTSKQTNKQMCMLPLFQSQIFSYLFCDQSSLVPFNYFVVLSMTLSRILILIFVYFFSIKHLKILPFANITHLTTVGKSSAEKTYTESKEVVINILPREPSATRPAI